MHKPLKALITGGAKGIGLAISQALQQKGFQVTALGRDEQSLAIAKAAGFIEDYLVLDLAIGQNWDELANKLTFDFSVLVNNAGIYVWQPAENTTSNDVQALFALNFFAAEKLSSLCLGHMKQQRWGRILNIASVSGTTGEANAGVYAASKGALIAYSRSLALELASLDITVNCISPGWVKTELFTRTELSEEEILSTVPAHRWVSASELGALAAFLCGDEAQSITGQNICVCAGLSLG